MHAANSALQTLAQQKTAQDLVMAKAFTGKIVDEIPCQGNPGECSQPGVFLSDVGYLIQITNMKNRGTFTRRVSNGESWACDNDPCDQDCLEDPDCSVTGREVKPNFLTHGWFPAPIMSDQEQGGTNLVEVLYKTINDFATGAPPNCRKIIILATDGLSSCSYDFNSNSPARTCPSSKDYNTYLTAKSQLIGNGGRSILDLLKKNEISLTVLLAGDYVEPNFLNIKREGGQGSHPSIYLDYLEAVGLGFTGFASIFGKSCPPYSSCEFFDVSSDGASRDEQAFLNAGVVDGVKFRDPNGVLGKMAMESGGIWCPLQPLADSGCYTASGLISDDPDCRPAGKKQAYSIYNEPKAVTAARCASSAVGYNPYFLAEPKTVMLNGGGSS